MTHSLDLTSPASVSCCEGELLVTPPTTIAVRGHREEVALDVPGLAGCDSVEVWAGTTWCCCIGLQDQTVVAARPDAGLLAVVGSLERLDLRGGYDPGGMHAVTYHELEDDHVLLVYELGAARLSRDDGIVWQRTHGNLTFHLSDVDADAAWFEGEDGRIGFLLVNGAIVT